MKKRICCFILAFILIAVCQAGCGKKDNGMKKVVLNEVAHSIFYAPQYVAIEMGYFKDAGIDLVLETRFRCPTKQ